MKKIAEYMCVKRINFETTNIINNNILVSLGHGGDGAWWNGAWGGAWWMGGGA